MSCGHGTSNIYRNLPVYTLEIKCAILIPYLSKISSITTLKTQPLDMDRDVKQILNI